MLVLCVTCTHAAPYNLLLAQKVHWAHTGTLRCGSQHVAPCSVAPLAGVQLPMPSHGEETPLGPAVGDGGGVTSDSVTLGLDCCSVTTFPFQAVPPSQNIMLFYSSGQTDSFSQKSLCNSLISI